jgi:hypothetical protein
MANFYAGYVRYRIKELLRERNSQMLTEKLT